MGYSPWDRKESDTTARLTLTLARAPQNSDFQLKRAVKGSDSHTAVQELGQKDSGKF